MGRWRSGRPSGTDACEDEARRVARRFVAEHPGLVGQGGWACSDGPGLAQPLRRALEDYLGCDVSDVRIRSDARAAEAAAGAGAQAFACGRDVVFGPDRFRPATPEGLELLAHELVHVVQQGAAPRRSRGGVEIVGKAPVGPQRSEMPSQIYSELCPPGCRRVVIPSSGPLGTVYGTALGMAFLLERRPRPYAIVDFAVWQWGALKPGTIATHLPRIDPEVSFALKALRPKSRKAPFPAEWGRVGVARTDILDAERQQVYEIKPYTLRAEGAEQLQEYITALNAACSVGTKRVWGPGDWAPPARPVVSGGVHGAPCFLRAWRDAEIPGLILYELSCCIPQDENAHDYQVLVPVKMTQIERHLEPMRPRLEAALQAYVPVAPKGSDYAILATQRFFGLFVLLPIRQEQDRLTRVRPTPAMVEWMLGSLAALLPAAATTVIPANAVLASMSPDDREFLIDVLGKVIAAEIVALAAIAIVGALVLAPEVLAWLLEGGETAELGMAAEESFAELEATEATEALEGAGEATPADEVEGPWMNGDGTGVGSDMGPTQPPNIDGPPPGGPPDMSAPGLMGIVPLLPVTANAGTGTPPKAKPLASEPILVVPSALVTPKRGKVEVGAQVQYGKDTYFVIALAASAPR